MNQTEAMNIVIKNFVQLNKFPDFKAGDTITVHYKIKEGDRERIQQFQGTVIQSW